MFIFHKKTRKMYGILVALVIMVGFTSHNCFAQMKNVQNGLFMTINGSLSSGHMINVPEGSQSVMNSSQTLANANIGFLCYWQHLSGEAQFSFSPFIGSLTSASDIFKSKSLGLQFWFGYTILDNELFTAAPFIGFGTYRFHGQSNADDVLNPFVNAGLAGEVFIPESRFMIGVRGGYQHNFTLPANADVISANAGGAVVQLRTGIRLF